MSRTAYLSLLASQAILATSLLAQQSAHSGVPATALTTTGSPSCAGDSLDARTYALILNRQFSALVSPATEGIPGSFIGIDIKDGQASASQSFVLRSGRVFTVSARGGVNDGVVAILNDATLAPKFGASVQLHHLAKARRTLQFDVATCEAMDVAVRKADLALAVRLAELGVGGDSIQRRIERAGLMAKGQALAALLTGVMGATDSATVLRRDSLRLEGARVDARLAWLDRVPIPEVDGEELAARLQRSKAYREARKLIDVPGYSFSWWSYGLSIDNASFNLFDPMRGAIDKETFLTTAAFLTFGHISKNAAGGTNYTSVSVTTGFENNISQLAKVELTDRTQLTPPPSERYTEKKTTAFQGDYRENVETFRLAIDHYRFLRPDDGVAIHIFPAWSASQGAIGEVSLGVGLLASARNVAKKTSNLNAELFFNVPDLPNVNRSSKGPWKRGVLGLRVAFPFNVSSTT